MAFQRSRSNSAWLKAGLGGFALCLGMASGPAKAAPEGLAQESVFADRLLISRDALVTALVESSTEPAFPGATLAEAGSAESSDESSRPLLFGISQGASLIPTGLAPPSSHGLGLKQQASASNPLSVWFSSANSNWLPTFSYTLDQQGSGGFAADESRVTGIGNSGSSLRTHNVDLGWSGAVWHAGYRLDSTAQRQIAQGRLATEWQSTQDSAYLGVTPGGDIDLTLDLGIDRVRDGFSGDLTRWHTQGVSASWPLGARAGLNAGLTVAKAQAGEFQSGIKSRTADVTFTYRLNSAESDASVTRHVFLRLDHQRLEIAGNDFDTAGSSSAWSINFGLVLSAF
jgi:hypothetical protein